ncbi:MAG: heme exporter protein CcmD [Pseudomonadota bacterium]
MIPDLGKHALPILTSYGVSLALIGILIWISIWRFNSVRHQLEEIESKVKSRV